VFEEAELVGNTDTVTDVVEKLKQSFGGHESVLNLPLY